MNPTFALAISTTCQVASCALYSNNIILDYKASQTINQQSEELAELIYNLFHKRPDTITLQNISTIFIDIGPGSFTGIRTGIAYVIGLQLGLNNTVIPVNTLDALAYHLINKHPAQAKRNRYLSMIANIRNSFYTAITGPTLKRRRADAIIDSNDIENIITQYKVSHIITNTLLNDINNYSPKLSALNNIKAVETAMINAKLIGECGLFLLSNKKVASNNINNEILFEPNYLATPSLFKKSF